MIKKAILGTGATVLLGLLFFGSDLFSYVRTSAGYVRESVRDAIPMDVQIDHARQMIKDLVPEIRKNMHVIAKEEAEVARLEGQITDAEAKLAKEKDEMLRLKADLGTGERLFHYASRSYTSEQVKTNLANRFERYKTNEATLASLREIHKARQTSLDAAREKLEGMLAAKRQLGVEVENLQARLQMVETAQTTASYSFDDSKLGRAKEMISDLKTRLDVAERMVNAEGYYHDDIPLDQTAPENIVEQVSEYFASPKEGSKSLELVKQ